MGYCALLGNAVRLCSNITFISCHFPHPHGIDWLILLWELLDLSGHELVSGLLKEVNNQPWRIFCFKPKILFFYIIDEFFLLLLPIIRSLCSNAWDMMSAAVIHFLSNVKQITWDCVMFLLC